MQPTKRQPNQMATFHPNQGSDLPPPLPANTQIPSLPLPPGAYVTQYSEEAVRRGRVPKPPPPPTAHETYSMYGTPYHADDPIIKPLESQGIRRLYPQNLDHRKELKKLNHSILLNYLDLLETVIVSPDSCKRQEKLDDISLLFIHMHHLINEFRPHQARETLRVMMEVQKRQAYDASDRFQNHLEKVLEIIKQNLNDIPEQEGLDDEFKLSDYYRDKKKPSTVNNRDQIMCEIADAL